MSRNILYRRSYHYLRLDDMTVLHVLIIIPRKEDISKINNDAVLFEQIFASACTLLQRHLSTPISSESNMYITTGKTLVYFLTTGILYDIDGPAIRGVPHSCLAISEKSTLRYAYRACAK